MARRLPALAVVCLCACGRDPVAPPSVATVFGSIGGVPFGAANAIATNDVDFPANLIVTIGNFDIACADLSHFISGKLIDLVVGDVEGCPGSCTILPVPAGTYSIINVARGTKNGPQASVDYSATDAQCRSVGDFSADLGGTVTLTKAGHGIGEEVQGSFDVVIDGNHLVGTFQTAVCAVPTSVSHVCR